MPSAHPVPVVLAVDPGRAKCGVAVVDREGIVLHRVIVSTEELPAVLADLEARHAPEAILLGDGTGAAALHARLAVPERNAPLVRVDERHTSEQARARYLAEVPARGWRRLLPRALRTPETPYDDFVAVILAERWWQAQKQDIGPDVR